MKKSRPIPARLAEQLFDNLSEPPRPNFSSSSTAEEVQKMIRKTAVQTSSISAALAIPGGVTGLVTVLPEIASIWKLQAQMISNVAAAEGKNYLLTREQMLWCMFRQMGYGIVKEYVFQRGGVYVVKRMQHKVFERALHKVGLGMVTRQGTRMAGKIIPVLGSVSAGALSYYDTMRVGRNAVKLYSSEIYLLPESTAGTLEEHDPNNKL